MAETFTVDLVVDRATNYDRRAARFARYAWGVVAYNIAVVLWGAYVRATGSGAGCGSHWPLCNGEVIPRAPEVETLIEFTHRATSGLALLSVIGLFFWARRLYGRGHIVRRGATLSLLFIITEALIGAGLVLFELVAHDRSLARAFSLAAHLVNTFVLLAVMTLTAWWAQTGNGLDLARRKPQVIILAIALAATLVVGMSGAVAALGDTLFPVDSLREGIRQDFSETAHLLVRLRVLHPTLAVASSLYLLVLAGSLALWQRETNVRRFAFLTAVLVIVQLCAGVANLLLLAPVWMQLVHLLLADALWLTLVLLTASVLARSARAVRPHPELVQ
ncbi:MAG: cytochrome oxidase assembly protein [Pyrinomonas sp.]|uniref:COX15/CtaA family protein n=1 Tax=Pyrinomonas sp. TaxID=2080306 RepID=UPI00332F3135